MPKKKTPIGDAEVEAVVKPQQEETEGEQFEPTDDDYRVNKIIRSMPQNEPCLELSRTHPKGGRPEFLEDMTPATFSRGYVAQKYGGGLYILTGIYSNGTEQKSRFDIAGEPFPVKRLQPAVMQTLLPNQPEPIRPVELPPNAGLPEMFASLVTMMQNIMVQNKASEVDMLNKMRLYKELFATPERERHEAPLDQAFTMIQKGMELGQMAGGGDSSSMTMMILKELKDPVVKIVEALTQKRGMPVPVVHPGAVTPAAPAAAPGQEPEKEQENMVMILFKQYIPSLVAAATRGADVSIYTDYILDQVPPLYYDTVKTWLKQPDLLEQLCKVEPAIKNQLAWWADLQNDLISALIERATGGSQSLQPEPASESPANGPADI